MKVKPHFYGFCQRDMPFRADAQTLENASQLGPVSQNLWPSTQYDWENHSWAQTYKNLCIWQKTVSVRVQLTAHQGCMLWPRKHSLGVWAAEVSGSCSLQCGLFEKTNTGQAALGTGRKRLERKCPRAFVKGPKIRELPSPTARSMTLDPCSPQLEWPHNSWTPPLLRLFWGFHCCQVVFLWDSVLYPNWSQTTGLRKVLHSSSSHSVAGLPGLLIFFSSN